MQRCPVFAEDQRLTGGIPLDYCQLAPYSPSFGPDSNLHISCSALLSSSGMRISALTQWLVQLSPNRNPFFSSFASEPRCLIASSKPGLESPGADQYVSLTTSEESSRAKSSSESRCCEAYGPEKKRSSRVLVCFQLVRTPRERQHTILSRIGWSTLSAKRAYRGTPISHPPHILSCALEH
jgi:hypothetical protein